MLHLDGTHRTCLEDAREDIVGLLVGETFEGLPIQRDDVEGGQAELVAACAICQGRCDIGAAGTSFFTGHVEFGSDDGFMDAGVFQAFRRLV
jgi:hypothetical protein